MCNKNQVEQLCEEYGYEYADYFGDIQVKTPSDWWVIKNIKGTKIELYHKNKRAGTGYHFQRTFKRGIRDVFYYIERHEQIPFKSHNKVFRIKELLNML